MKTQYVRGEEMRRVVHPGKILGLRQDGVARVKLDDGRVMSIHMSDSCRIGMGEAAGSPAIKFTQVIDLPLPNPANADTMRVVVYMRSVYDSEAAIWGYESEYMAALQTVLDAEKKVEEERQAILSALAAQKVARAREEQEQQHNKQVDGTL
jgi:hypothetical protein